MGANIAGDIARGELSEATIAYNVLANGQLLQVGGCCELSLASGANVQVAVVLH